MTDNNNPVHPLERRPQPQPQPEPPQPQGPVIRPPEQSQPIVTYVLLGINIVIFLIDMALGRELTMLGWKQNDLIVAGEYYRLITPMFLHGNLIHLGFNSYFLYIVGPQIERAFGPLRFIVLYFVAGLAGSIASFALTPAPSIGASGALFGLLGAFIPFLYRNRSVMRNTRQRLMSILQVIGINLFFGLVVSNIDNWAHLGGMLGGMVFAWFATPLYKTEPAGYFSSELKVVDKSDQGMALLAAVGLGALLLVITYWLIQLRA